METLPFAFSVHHFISSVGADAGFASIIGLAILVLLYFAQARETATLRSRADEAAQRVRELEGELAQLGRQRAAQRVVARGAVPARAAAHGVAAVGQVGPVGVPSAGVPAGAVALAGPPAPPAGVAAPALLAATKLIPTPMSPWPEDGRGADNAREQALENGLGADNSHERPLEEPPVVPEPPVIAAPPPATVAGGTNGAAREPSPGVAREPSPAVAREPSPAVAREPSPRSPADAPGRPSSAPPPLIRPAAARPGELPRRGPARRRSRVGRVIAIVAGAVLAGAVVAVLLTVTKGGGTQSSSSASRTSNAPAGRTVAQVAPVKPSAVTVSVLNGTGSTGLAGRVSQRLAQAGYKQGIVGNAANQTTPTTIVAYMPGDKRDALAVANTLKLRLTSVQPIDSNTQKVACPPPAPCSAAVVVTVGPDLATQ